jgi:hypothetical protein
MLSPFLCVRRFGDLLWIRCVAETKWGREGRLARLPGLAAGYG